MKLDFEKNTKRNIVANTAGSAVKMLFPAKLFFRRLYYPLAARRAEKRG